MFKNPFSFKGRIRRTEYGISLIIMYIISFILSVLLRTEEIVIILLLPVYWFRFAQGAKRCHDRGNSGWYQIIPFYGLWMLFADSENSVNDYGINPKGIEN